MQRLRAVCLALVLASPVGLVTPQAGAGPTDPCGLLTKDDLILVFGPEGSEEYFPLRRDPSVGNFCEWNVPPTPPAPVMSISVEIRHPKIATRKLKPFIVKWERKRFIRVYRATPVDGVNGAYAGASKDGARGFVAASGREVLIVSVDFPITRAPRPSVTDPPRRGEIQWCEPRPGATRSHSPPPCHVPFDQT